MAIRMEKGPFRRFEGEWQITALGNEACKIELALRYEFDNALGRVAGRIFDGIADTIVDAFARRAEEERMSARGAENNPAAFKKPA
jgi:ribosome-associated toxin RatA of RatAB toxin-antitoxin module